MSEVQKARDEKKGLNIPLFILSLTSAEPS